MLKNRLSAITNFISLSLLAGFGALLLFGTPVEASTRADVQQWIIEEAELTKVPPALALAVAKVESDFRDDALGSHGERGVMQIMPSTARGEFGVAAGRLWDGRLNINLGIRYLEKLYNQYGRRWNLALSHYNGGTLKGRGANAVPHSYNRKYVTDVLGWRNTFERRNLVAQIKQSVEVADATHSSDVGTVDYWMFDDPEVEKGWRHYADVAAYWLKPKEERVRIADARRDRAYETTDNDAVDAPRTWSLGGWTETRPSDRLKKGVARLRRSFRRHIRSERRHWASDFRGYRMHPGFRRYQNTYGQFPRQS
jgi:hypothetical protein